MAQTIGQVPARVDLIIHVGADRNFDVTWKDPAGVPVPIQAGSIKSQVRESTGSTVLLDIGAHTTVDPDGHTMHVAIPASDTAPLSGFDALWSFIATSTGGETKLLMSGTARALQTVSA